MSKSEKNQIALVSLDMAKEELDKFLNFHYVKKDQQEESKSMIDIMIDRICDGSLVVNDDASLSYTLKEPLENGNLKVLNIGNRCTRKMIIPLLKGVDPKEVDMRMAAYTAALTGVNKGVLLDLSVYDQKLTDSVVGFIVG